MATITLTVLTLLATLTIYAMRRSSLIIRAERELQLLADASIGCHSQLGGIGCSLICRNARSMAQVENLLSVTYDRYEAIVMVDATQQTELFSELLARYRMVKVNTPAAPQNVLKSYADSKFGHSNTLFGHANTPKRLCNVPKSHPNTPKSQENVLKSRGGSTFIRSLYRSAERRYRRLVVVEISANTDPCTALNEALTIASYNFIIIIDSNAYIRPQAIHSIAITLSDSASLCPEMLLSASDEPCHIFRREAVIQRGGFSPTLPRKIPHSKRLCTHQQFTLSPTSAHPSGRLAGVLTAGLIIVATTAWLLHRMLIATPSQRAETALCITLLAGALLTTLLAMLSIARHQSKACGAGECSTRAMLCYFLHIRTIFSRRKFIIT